MNETSKQNVFNQFWFVHPLIRDEFGQPLLAGVEKSSDPIPQIIPEVSAE
jgi:hypothetical protein